MKKILAIVTILCTLTKVDAQIYTIPWAQQQPRWVFPLWFEDAAGKKDTLYFAWDEEAETFSIDSVFGEIRLPADSLDYPYDTASFMPWILAYKNDPAIGGLDDYTEPCQGFVINYITDFPNDNGFNLRIYMYPDVYEYPVIIRWDRNMFTSDSLIEPVTKAKFDNDYIFFAYAGEPDHQFDLMENDSIVLPEFNWFSQRHFPLLFLLGTNEPLSVDENKQEKIAFYPNPASDNIRVNTEKIPFNSIRVLDLMGNEVLFYNNVTASQDLFIGSLTSGIYFIQLNDLKNKRIFYEKLIKR